MTEPKPEYRVSLDAGVPHRFECTVLGDPVPKHTELNKKTRRLYTSAESREYMNLVRDYVALMWKAEPLTVILALTLHFFTADARKKDNKNMLAGIEDALSRLVWRDDCQIWEHHLKRSVDRDNPRVEILVEVL